jgi:DNA sulfur modification protein DndD
MHLAEVRLKNVRVFQDEHVLQLDPPTEQANVYLVGGTNGAGKTTLLQGIVLGLYGERAGLLLAGQEWSAPRYREFVTACLSDPLRRDDRSEMEIGISISRDGVDTTIVRTWWFTRGEYEDEDIRILEGGEPLPIDVASDEERKRVFTEYIEAIAPARVGKFFFFDGEEIKNIANKEPGRAVVEGLNQLLGFHVLERLLDDLETVRASIRKELPGAAEAGLTEAVSRVEEARRDVANRQYALQQRTAMRDEINSVLHSTDLELSALFDGRTVQSQSEALDALADREREIATVTAELQSFVAEVLTLALPNRLANGAARRAKQSLKSREDRAARRRLRPVGDEVLEGIFGGKAPSPTERLTRQQKSFLKQRFREVWDDVTSAKEGGSDWLEVLSADELRAIPRTIAEASATARRELAARLARRAHLLDEVSRLRRAESLFEAGGRAQELLDLKGQTLQALLEHDAAIEKERAQIDAAEHAQIVCEGLVLKLEGQLVSDASTRARLGVIERTEATVKAFMNELRSQRGEGLAELTTQMVRRLSHKEDLIAKVVIDPIDFRIKMLGPDDQQLTDLSAGEKEVFALALVWALGRISNKALPMVIDTPLARLDHAHRRNVVERFLPVASNQVLLLATDTEVDGEWYRILKPRIRQETRIEFLEVSRTSRLDEGRYLDLQPQGALA